MPKVAKPKRKRPDEDAEARFLTPLRGEAKPKPVAAFDCETHGTKNRFVLGCVSAPDEDITFEDAGEMLSWLGDYRRRGQLIYATNLHFDAFALFQEVAGERQIPPGWTAFDNGSKLVWVKRRVDYESEGQERYVTLLDSLNLFPLGVYDLGSILQKVNRGYARRAADERLPDAQREAARRLAEYYDVQKLEAPRCMGKRPLERLSVTERLALERYCAADAEVTRKFMEWANERIVELGAKPKLTAASTAMDLFRRRHLEAPIPQPSLECMTDSRRSYYGGRTEDYWKGNVGECWEHDVTAMYPSVMEQIEFPYPSPENFERADRPSESVLEWEGFAKATVVVPDDEFYPPLPYRARDHLLFPVGQLEGVWTHLQLRRAVELGCEVRHLHWSYYNTRTFNPFKGYVRALIDLRMKYLCPGCERYDRTGKRCWEDGVKCDNADAVEEVVKLFLNGLYGKFAQNFLTEEEGERQGLYVKKGGGTFKPVGEASADELRYTMERHPAYFARGIAVRKSEAGVRSFMNPILAAYVTSAAQVKINDLQQRALAHGVPTYYTDTDSLLNPKPLPFSIKGKQLGELQLGGHYDELVIVGPKAKMVKTRDGKRKATFKGVPGKSWIVDDPVTMATTQVKPREQLFDMLKSGKLQVTFTRFAKHREALVRDLSVNEMTQMTKEFKPLENTKRRVLGKPAIKRLLNESFESRPWRVGAKGELK